MDPTVRASTVPPLPSWLKNSLECIIVIGLQKKADAAGSACTDIFIQMKFSFCITNEGMGQAVHVMALDDLSWNSSLASF